MQTMWKDADPTEVRGLWAEELGRYDGSDIKAALEALRYAHVDYPPTLYEFASLCRDARKMRTQSTQQVTVRYGKPSPEVLAMMHELAKAPGKRKVHPRDWARKLVRRELDGDTTVNAYALQCAKEALGMVEEVGE